MRIEVAAPQADVEKALSDHVGADWRQKLAVSQEKVSKEGRTRRLGEIPSPEIITLITHAAAAVVGGMAYDATKELLAFLRRRFGAHNVSSDDRPR